MTQLYIDGIEVVLPKSFSVQVKRENPLITKNGEYTYDVTLSLTNPVNADLYRHLNRLNVQELPRSKRSAVLIADNRVYCNGTEVITGWTEKEVNVQVASGNSELNYVIGGDRLISSIDLMPVSSVMVEMQKHVEKTYPEIDYCLAPVFDETLGQLANAWGVQYGVAGLQTTPLMDGKMYAQPFLCAYIRAVLKGLGYEMQTNQLEDTVYKDLYICQTNAEEEWRDMLPEWTVVDFLQQVENLFNGIFVVDNRDRTVNFVFRNSYFAGPKSVHVQDVSDIYEVDVEEDPDIEDMAQANVSYKLDDSEFWRFRCLANDLRKSITFEEVAEPNATPRSWFSRKENQRNDVVFVFPDGMQYLFQGTYQTPSEMKDYPMYRIVDDFRPLLRDSSSDYELDIAPASFRVSEIPNKPSAEGATIHSPNLMLPVITSSAGSPIPESADLNEIIGNNSLPTTGSKSRISLAFFAGRNYSMGRFNGVEIFYPLPFVDKYTYSSSTINGKVVPLPMVVSDDSHTLKLSKLDELYYQGTYDIDFKRGIKLTSHDPNVYNPRMVFEIRNKRYICAEIEYTIDAEGRKGAWTGTFYPIKISDTEADARWILADGKWRDGGVWLDNGRWLDE